MDYEFKTTFWDDFSIADRFGENGIKDTYNRAFKHWKNDIVFITELVIVLNWKARYWSDNGRPDLSKLYADLREKTHDWCCDNLKGEDLKYYLRTTD